MEDFFAIPEDRLTQTPRFLREELKRRGWTDAKYIRSGANGIIFATRPDGKKVRFCSCFPNETTVIASSIADDKVLGKGSAYSKKEAQQQINLYNKYGY